MYVNAHVRACMCVSLHIHVLKYTNYNLLYDYTTDLAKQAKHFQASLYAALWKKNKTSLLCGHLLIARRLVVLNCRMQRGEEA